MTSVSAIGSPIVIPRLSNVADALTGASANTAEPNATNAKDMTATITGTRISFASTAR